MMTHMKTSAGNPNTLSAIKINVLSKRLKKETRTQVNHSTFIFIADKVFGFPVVDLPRRSLEGA